MKNKEQNKDFDIMQITKSQHYVPQKYLKSWVFENDFVSMRHNKKVISSINVKNVAQESYFYKHEKLNYNEFCFVVEYLAKKLEMPHKYLQMHLTSDFGPIVFQEIDNDKTDDDFEKIFEKICKEKLFDDEIINIIQRYRNLKTNLKIPEDKKILI